MVQGSANAIFPYCHTYIYNGDALILFDPQCGRSRLVRGLKELGKSLSDVDFIINSHFHTDHTRSNAFVKKRSNAKLLIHEADCAAIESLDEYVNRYGMTDPELQQNWRTTLKTIGFKESTPDGTFKDGEILPGGFRIIHTPGHVFGHCSFYKDQILISGDIDFVSVWVGNTTSNVADYLNSIEHLKMMKIKMILPAHNQPVFDNINERLELFRQRFFQREQKIYNALPDQPITLQDFTQKMIDNIVKFKQYPTELSFHFGKTNTLNFLIHLETQRKVKRIITDDQELWQKLE